MAKGSGKGRANALECCAVCGTAVLCCLIVLIALTLIGLGIAKIVIGAVYFHQCSIQRLIPIYLIVSGVVPLFLGGFARVPDDDNNSSTISPGQICGMIGFLFNVVWLICGTIWVYPTFAKVHASKNYAMCNNVLLDFAFAMVTLDWIFDGLWIILIIYLIVRYVIARTSTSSSSFNTA